MLYPPPSATAQWRPLGTSPLAARRRRWPRLLSHGRTARQTGYLSCAGEEDAGDRAAATGCGDCPVRAGVMRQIVFDKSSATISAPFGSTVTPTGRPRVVPSLSRNPVTKSTGGPAGRPSRNGTNTTL